MSHATTIEVATDGPRTTVTLNRPTALNAITEHMLKELGDVFAALSRDDHTRVVVLIGSGRAFSAGVDLKSLQGRPLVDGEVGDVLDVPARRLIETMRTMDPVVIAAVNGHCYTGALEIALAADVLIASEDAVFGDTHAKFGLRPTWARSRRLPQALGMSRARFLSYTGRTFTGRQAEQWGLAALACPPAEFRGVVDEVATAIAANSAGSIAAYKDLYRAAETSALPEGIAYEAGTRYPIPDTEARLSRFR